MKNFRYGALLPWDQFLVQELYHKDIKRAGFSMDRLLETPALGVFIMFHGKLGIRKDRPGVVYERDPFPKYWHLLLKLKKSRYPEVFWSGPLTRATELIYTFNHVIQEQDRLAKFIDAGNVYTDYATLQTDQEKAWLKNAPHSASVSRLARLSPFYPVKNLLTELPPLSDKFRCPTCGVSAKFSTTFTVTMDFDKQGRWHPESIRGVEMRGSNYITCEKCAHSEHDDSFELPEGGGNAKNC